MDTPSHFPNAFPVLRVLRDEGLTTPLALEMDLDQATIVSQNLGDHFELLSQTLTDDSLFTLDTLLQPFTRRMISGRYKLVKDPENGFSPTKLDSPLLASVPLTEFKNFKLCDHVTHGLTFQTYVLVLSKGNVPSNNIFFHKWTAVLAASLAAATELTYVTTVDQQFHSGEDTQPQRKKIRSDWDSITKQLGGLYFEADQGNSSFDLNVGASISNYKKNYRSTVNRVSACYLFSSVHQILRFIATQGELPEAFQDKVIAQLPESVEMTVQEIINFAVDFVENGVVVSQCVGNKGWRHSSRNKLFVHPSTSNQAIDAWARKSANEILEECKWLLLKDETNLGRPSLLRDGQLFTIDIGVNVSSTTPGVNLLPLKDQAELYLKWATSQKFAGDPLSVNAIRELGEIPSSVQQYTYPYEPNGDQLELRRDVNYNISNEELNEILSMFVDCEDNVVEHRLHEELQQDNEYEGVSLLSGSYRSSDDEPDVENNEDDIDFVPVSPLREHQYWEDNTDGEESVLSENGGSVLSTLTGPHDETRLVGDGGIETNPDGRDYIIRLKGGAGSDESSNSGVESHRQQRRHNEARSRAVRAQAEVVQAEQMWAAFGRRAIAENEQRYGTRANEDASHHVTVNMDPPEEYLPFQQDLLDEVVERMEQENDARVEELFSREDGIGEDGEVGNEDRFEQFEDWDAVGNAINNMVASGLNSYPLALDADGFGNAHTGKIPFVPTWRDDNLGLQKVILNDPHHDMAIQGGQVYSPSFRTAMKLPSSLRLIQRARYLSDNVTTLLTSDPVVMYLNRAHLSKLIRDIKETCDEVYRLMQAFHSYHSSRSQEQVRFEYFFVFSDRTIDNRWKEVDIPKLGNAIRSIVVATTTNNMCKYFDSVIRHVYWPLKKTFGFMKADDLFDLITKLRYSSKAGLLYISELAGYLVGGLNCPGQIMKAVREHKESLGNYCRPPEAICTQIHPDDMWTGLPFALSPSLLPDWNQGTDKTPKISVILRKALRANMRHPKEYYECANDVRYAALKICQEANEQGEDNIKYHQQIDYLKMAELSDQDRKRFLSRASQLIVIFYQQSSGCLLLEKARRTTNRPLDVSPREYAGMANEFAAPTHVSAHQFQDGSHGFLKLAPESIRTMGKSCVLVGG